LHLHPARAAHRPVEQQPIPHNGIKFHLQNKLPQAICRDNTKPPPSYGSALRALHRAIAAVLAASTASFDNLSLPSHGEFNA
jgi:hypothetical protein